MNIKDTILYIAIIALFVLLMLERCNKPKPVTVEPKRDTVTSIQYIPQPVQTVQPYQPQPIIISQPAQNIPIQYTQLSSDVRELSKQVQQLAAQFYAVNNYRDSVVLRDSVGTKVGVVNLNDVVSENSIKSRAPSYQLSFPVTERTIIVKEQYKPVKQVFLGGGITGSKDNLVSAFEAGVLLKTKRDQVYGVKAGINLNGNIVYGLSSYWKLRLKR